MKRWLGLFVSLAISLASSQAFAANSSVPSMTAATSVAGTDLWYCAQSAGTLDRKCTSAQVAAYIYGLMSGDATASGTGTFTLATVNSNVGSFGSTTNCPSFTVNAKGLITAASAAACAPPFTAVTGNATLAQLPTLGANSIYINPTGSTAAPQSIAVPACANDGAHGLVYVNGTGLQCASISGSGAVSSVTGGIGVTVSPTTGAVVISAPATRRDNTTTTDTITSSDKGTIVTESNASAVAVTITTAGFVSTDFFTIKNKGAGLATYTPSSGTINGAATIACAQNQSADLYFDGTNYQALANTCQLGTAATQNTGTSGGTIPLLNGNNTFSGNNTHSGSETFTEVIGGGRTVSGTTDTLAATDCGTTVVYSNAGAVTVTVPQGLPTFCVISLLQSGAGKVSTNGSAVTPATQHAAGSFTGTRAQWSVINITNYTTNTVVLSGDAS